MPKSEEKPLQADPCSNAERGCGKIPARAGRQVARGPAMALGLAVACSGCASLYHLDEYTTGDGPSAPNGSSWATPPPASTGDSSTQTAAGSVDHPSSHPAARCRTNAECTESAPSICVEETGTCTPVLSKECPRVYGTVTHEDALIVGAILGIDGTVGGGQEELERAAALAAAELGAGRPFALVACDVAGDVLRSARHLVDDLRLTGIVGPTLGEDVVTVSQQASVKAGAAVMTPSALSASITALADSDLTWRDVPSDGQRAKLVIDQIRALESLVQVTRAVTSVKLGIIHADDAQGVGARESIATKLVINGKFMSDPANAELVSIDTYSQSSDRAAQAEIASRYAGSFRPDIVFITAGEQVANVVVPLEQALTAARALHRPFYVLTEAAKTRDLLDAIVDGRLPSDVRRRIRGIGTKSETGSSTVAAGFAARFAAKYGAAPTRPAAAASYDAVYALAYAMTAGAKGRGEGVAQALRSFAVGTPFEVGPGAVSSILDELAAGRSVSLRGTFGRLNWDSSGDLAAGLVEVWCVGGSGATATFGSSGLTMDVETQVVGGGFVQCQ